MPNNVNASAGNNTALDSLGEYQEALTYYDSILATDPYNVNASAGKGGALFYLGRYDEAIANFDRALQVDPYNVNALDGKGAILDSLGEHQEAIQYYDKALQVDPYNENILNNKGGALVDIGRYDEAMQFTDRALQVDPYDGNIINNKGSALFYLGRYDEAIANFDRALQVDPYNVNALTNIGTALALSGRHQEAIGFFEYILLYIDPNYVPALVNLGIALENLGRHQEAIGYYERASLSQQSSVNTTPTFNSKNNELALMTNVVEKNHFPKNRVMHYHADGELWNLQIDSLGRSKEGYELRYISHGYQVNVGEQTLWGIAEFKKINYPGAIAIFDEILRLNVMHPDGLVKMQQLTASYWYIGECWFKQGDATKATQYKSQASAIDPSYNGGIPPMVEVSPPIALFVSPLG